MRPQGVAARFKQPLEESSLLLKMLRPEEQPF
jgi:hypothetical protein